jgi:hypothetical protein
LPAIRCRTRSNATGIQAAHVENLWWLMFWVCTAVFVARDDRARRSRSPARAAPSARRVARVGARRAPLTRWVAGALAVCVLLGVLFFASIFTDRALAQLPLEDACTSR